MAPSAPASPLALTIGRTILSLHGRTMPRAARCRSPFLSFQHGQQMRLGRAPAPLNVVRAFSISSSLFSSLLFSSLLSPSLLLWPGSRNLRPTTEEPGPLQDKHAGMCPLCFRFIVEARCTRRGRSSTLGVRQVEPDWDEVRSHLEAERADAFHYQSVGTRKNDFVFPLSTCQLCSVTTVSRTKRHTHMGGLTKEERITDLKTQQGKMNPRPEKKEQTGIDYK